ncbi:L10-interacting MYB domain-containing protein [Nymphaea thermarum]|nr:L10-interacting MYB domain-containing protein [Nymphaea thermarum]
MGTIIVTVQKGMEGPAVGRNRKNISWTPLMDDYFINLMVKEVHRGTKVENSFAKHGWSHMERLFQQKFGALYNKDCMKNRVKTLKKQYNAIKSLCEQSGIVWNHESQMLVVNDEATWEAYSKCEFPP